MVHTFHAILRGTTNLPENNLALERPEDNKTEFNCEVSTLHFCSIQGLPTIDIDYTSTMTDETVRGFQDIIYAYA